MFERPQNLILNNEPDYLFQLFTVESEKRAVLLHLVNNVNRVCRAGRDAEHRKQSFSDIRPRQIITYAT